ncbi:hypothetical protein GGR52DRAFT_152491 [Hypoxylon sp. FL1284]|nr:hypothetical protein GGR52DRAFT_152491 [Hypoxylon sp. FL1284]
MENDRCVMRLPTHRCPLWSGELRRPEATMSSRISRLLTWHQTSNHRDILLKKYINMSMFHSMPEGPSESTRWDRSASSSIMANDQAIQRRDVDGLWTRPIQVDTWRDWSSWRRSLHLVYSIHMRKKKSATAEETRP